MFQQVVVMGRLSADMEVKETNNGVKVGNFSIACTEKWDGGEHTEWFNCKFWGDRAFKLSPYMVKGKNILVLGTLKTREHEGKKYTDLVVRNISFGGDALNMVREPVKQEDSLKLKTILRTYHFEVA